MKKTKRGVSSAVLGLTLLVSSVMPMGSVFARTPSANEKIYGTDSFSQEYSRGTVFWLEGVEGMSKEFSQTIKDNSICDHITPQSDPPSDPKGAYCYNNHSRNENVYYIVRNGAVLNNQPLDVLVYPWVDADPNDSSKAYWGSYSAATIQGGFAHISLPSPSQTDVENIVTGDDASINIHLEFHFYKAGTAGKANAEEVSFKGVIGTSDLDNLEGFNIIQGFHDKHGFVDADTDLDFDGEHTWIGTQRTSSKTIFRAEVEGTAQKPLRIDYIVRTGLGTNLYSNTNKVSYNIKNLPTGVSNPTTDIVAKYGIFTPAKAPTVSGYSFDGWYTDENLTEKITGSIQVPDDVTLYGQYIQNVNIDYKVSGAPDDYTAPESAAVPKNSSYNPAELPKIDGYTFDGWYLDEDMTKKADETITVSEDITLYGKFVKESPAVPDTGINSKDGDMALFGQINPAILSIVSLLVLSGIGLGGRLYRRNRISKF